VIVHDDDEDEDDDDDDDEEEDVHHDHDPPLSVCTVSPPGATISLPEILPPELSPELPPPSPVPPDILLPPDPSFTILLPVILVPEAIIFSHGRGLSTGDSGGVSVDDEAEDVLPIPVTAIASQLNERLRGALFVSSIVNHEGLDDDIE
jgi:hypothetical protein